MGNNYDAFVFFILGFAFNMMLKFVTHSKEGLVALVEYSEKKVSDVKLKEMKSALTKHIAEVNESKQQVKDAEMPGIEVVRMLWDVIMDDVQWFGKNQQQYENSALCQVQTWAQLLKVSCSSAELEIELTYKVLTRCYEDTKLMNLLPELVRTLYGKGVLAEDVILHWFRQGSNSKGRQTFVKALEPFAYWLEEAVDQG